MRSVLRSLRSPAVIISILALVAGITGAAVAGPLASTSKLSKKDKKKVRNIAASEIVKLAPGLSVKSASSVGSGGVTQKSFSKVITVSLDFPTEAAGSCDTVSPAALDSVPPDSTVIMTPPQQKPIGWTVAAGTFLDHGVFVDFCDIDGGTTNPPAGIYRFNVITP